MSQLRWDQRDVRLVVEVTVGVLNPLDGTSSFVAMELELVKII
jgi:hypothetical protein